MSTSAYQRHTDYILSDAVWTASVAVEATYNISDFRFLLPFKRVKWASATTVTITATLPEARQADIAVVPMGNLTPGSATVLAISNNGSSGGINMAVPTALKGPGGWPLSTFKDLRTGTTAPQRTASIWNWLIVGNAVPVTMGAALWLGGPWRELAHNLDRGADDPPRYFGTAHENEDGFDLRYDHGTMKRVLNGTYTAASQAEIDDVMNWHDGNHGGSLPGVFVRDPSVNDAFLCYTAYTVRKKSIVFPVSATIDINLTELSKGKVL